MSTAHTPAQWQHWRLEALDTLFFREARPPESVGGAQLASMFPPPIRTLVGALRTSIGDAWPASDGTGVDWHAFAANPAHPLRDVMGDASGFGPLRFAGPDLYRTALDSPPQRLYPAPLWWMKSSVAVADGKGQTPDGKVQAHYGALEPSATAIQTDLGRVRLPVKTRAYTDKKYAGAKPLEHMYVTAAGLAAMLQGRPPQDQDVVPASDLYDTEDRLGIGRDSQRGTVESGLLYQTRHLRPRSDGGHTLAIGLRVQGLPDWMPASGLCRLGAEGRLAAWTLDRSTDAARHALPAPRAVARQVVLMLLSAARFEQGWLPDGFVPARHPERPDEQVWTGELHGVGLRIVSAVTGKAQREGGWDLVQRASRPLHSLVPAGSGWFCEVVSGDAAALHGQFIGQETGLGRGELAVGIW